jgi:hypothetical protein
MRLTAHQLTVDVSSVSLVRFNAIVRWQTLILLGNHVERSLVLLRDETRAVSSIVIPADTNKPVKFISSNTPEAA